MSSLALFFSPGPLVGFFFGQGAPLFCNPVLRRWRHVGHRAESQPGPHVGQAVRLLFFFLFFTGVSSFSAPLFFPPFVKNKGLPPSNRKLFGPARGLFLDVPPSPLPRSRFSLTG